MSESSPIYNLSPELAAFSEPVRVALHQIQAKPESEAAGALTRFVASIVHPDYACSLADLGGVDNDVKQAALELFEFWLTQGMTLDERAAIFRWISPYIGRQDALLPSR